MMKMIYGKCIRDKNQDDTVQVYGYDPLRDELAIKYLAGVVPQENNIDVELNVKENLLVYARFYRLIGKKAEERIRELVEFMELTDKMKAKIKELSGGMKRRLLIARALLHNPKLLILDEPTTGLDPQVRHLIWDKIRSLKKNGTTVLLTTHYMDEAFYLADTILIMNEGKKIMEGNPRVLLSENMEDFVLEVFDKSEVTENEKLMNNTRIRKEEMNDMCLLYSDSLETLKQLSSHISPGMNYLRQTNLEDLFLKMTGRQLSEKQ